MHVRRPKPKARARVLVRKKSDRRRATACRASLVAFYAAQPFETTPELPLPEGVSHVKEHYFGLLSFTLLQTLEQRQAPITYRELAGSSAPGTGRVAAPAAQRHSAKAIWTAKCSV